MQTTPFPEAASSDLARYLIYSKIEIAALLTQLRDGNALVTAYYGEGTDFAVTMLLAVDPARETVTFDDVSDPVAQRCLLGADRITFVAFLANIKIQFSVSFAEPVIHDGRPAFSVRIPDELLRLQRRDSFRVRTTSTKPATVLVPCAAGSNQYESLRVLDLSVGGMAVVSEPKHFRFELGAVVENCFLDLPGIGSVPAALRVRHVLPLGGKSEARRCGCQFVDLGAQARVMLQRYVNQMDAEHRRLEPAPRRP
jgi:flagellar brake protein